jgi:hypothetical protein
MYEKIFCSKCWKKTPIMKIFNVENVLGRTIKVCETCYISEKYNRLNEVKDRFFKPLNEGLGINIIQVKK